MKHAALKTAGIASLTLLIALGLSRTASAERLDDHAEETKPSVYYLEIVTPEAEATIALLAQTHDAEFSPPIAELGGARVIEHSGGGMIGVRGPLRPDEDPVVRPYMLVDDIDAAIAAAEEAGGEVAIPPMEIPGFGRFAIYILGGIDHGVWQQ